MERKIVSAPRDQTALNFEDKETPIMFEHLEEHFKYYFYKDEFLSAEKTYNHLIEMLRSDKVRTLSG